MSATYPPIRKAVFPVAGLGTRFLPATKAAPKEMLTVVNKPLIQYAVEEAYAAGIRQMIFVTCHNKRAIEDHFDYAYQLENELHLHDKNELLSIVQSVTPSDMECFYVRQAKPFGLGHAVLCAEKIVCNEAFAVILADDLMSSHIPVVRQLTQMYEEFGHSIVAVETIPQELTECYGIIQGAPWDKELLSIHHLVEKPKPHLAASNIAIVGRYVLTPSIFDHIRKLPAEEHKEIQLTDAINELVKKETVLALPYEGKRYDCGSVLGFLKANVDLGKEHPSEGNNFSKWLLNK
ncbi:UTP--glucose-1-phosphate uridylyltransferase GalU [Fluoribacter dumoffii]|uniref:UTP--glucose-1-phosphate uridylyltransferase GalU n=1 Tax=Fluoribacter dumoffii TaxID=463 RepID=UPI00224312A3|nr:UTP--glucose-1-phosphate uridylyltransferase GalU [Fluoribacter dumoffii]MCW8384932.1 UTP--glucose-1-phosphate uridylyltransferase GalU [Fluoribacter dumoffii]MCW8417993.1 UTP--glucose-1-phosphate uridylyltransferase GalU [Fluoribacter dumoffii]MCW8454165.1 UTP--glucose-1-phosphate uridylyltransferase GalU [Fluoribacter dumoffii]MCW8461761.1 UTP--glucose-1-phosphate uridylyltransferase GalU [Fluoribacter dumoffii]MCW8481977.1 UTP--glucose-1-phosphate uridylyltransferase GalU [Fluoribacter d